MHTSPGSSLITLLVPLVGLVGAASALGDDAALQLHLRSRANSGVQEKIETWEAKKTALIVCDMWDDHWCKSAARRVAEMAGPLNETIKSARAKGVFVIHAPSTCM